MGRSYYEILSVDRNANEKEIKKAYACLLRKYPPEKFPEEFSEISEAYEVLINDGKRKQYNQTNGFNEEAQKLMNEAMDRYHSEDYENAIKYFKKFILLEPNVNSARNYLSICYARLKNYDTAYKVLIEVFNTGDEILEVYFNNIFCYCDELNRYKEAEKYMLEALEIYNTFSINFNLVKIYTEKSCENIEKAKEILIKKVDPLVNIDECTLNDLFDLCYYSTKLNYYELLEKYLSYIKEVCDYGNIEYVIEELFSYAKLWIRLWQFEVASKYIQIIIDINISFDNGKEDFKDLKEYFQHIYNVCIESKEFLKEDKAYTEVLNYVFSKFELKISEDRSDKKRIIEELNTYTKELELAASESPYAIKECLDLIKQKYSLLYYEASEGIDKFYNIATNKIESCQNNYKNEIATKSSTSNNTSSKNSDSCGGGCGTIIVLMIIGGVLFGPVGAFAGAIIGLFISGK